MVDLNNRNVHGSNTILQNGLSRFRTMLKYLIFPVALPLVFLQECLTWFRAKLGLNNRNLEGKVVLITGASAGIGEALAQSFYRAGCRVILASRRKNELERVKNELVRSGLRTYAPVVFEMDLGDIKSLPSKAKAALAIYNGIDILVNNAGVLHAGTVLETDIEVDRKIMEVNYFGTLAFTRVIANNMKEKKSGHIVFVSSVQGKIGIPYSSAYSASKHAMQALADSLRAENADFGIDVTVISPGYVKTNISMNALQGTGAQLDRVIESHMSGLSPEYVADRTLSAVLNGEKDVVVSPLTNKFAIFLRYFAPMIFFLVMRYRARMYVKSS